MTTTAATTKAMYNESDCARAYLSVCLSVCLSDCVCVCVCVCVGVGVGVGVGVCVGVGVGAITCTYSVIAKPVDGVSAISLASAPFGV